MPTRPPIYPLVSAVLFAGAGVGLSHGALTWPGCPDLAPSDFREVVLVARGANQNAIVHDPNMIEPVGLHVHTDGTVYWTERRTTLTNSTNNTTGRIRAFDPATNTARTVLTLEVSTGLGTGQLAGNSREYGLRYVTFDPDFETNRQAYVIYNPRVALGELNRLSRFTVLPNGDFDPASEKVLIDMPWSMGICCHQGGAMSWDADGNLYFSTGNNVENSDNFAPMNSNNPTQDNQAAVTNTMDWRGKIFRIKPDGSEKGYSIPPGNYRDVYRQLGGAWVAGEDTTKILPEIYTLGHRNPYSLHVDKETGWLFYGDVGPDNVSTTASRGPVGNDEFNVVRGPGFHGWPYFVGPNRGYAMWNPASSSYSLPPQNPDSVFNNSPLNTGVTRLTPAEPSILPISRNSGQNNPAYGFGTVSNTSAFSGPMLRYKGTLASLVKMPPHLDGKWLIFENARNWVKLVTLNDSGTEVVSVEDFPGFAATFRPSGAVGMIDIQVGPHDGALYVAHYAAGFFQSSNATRIARIEYTGSCLPVSVRRTATEMRERQVQGFLHVHRGGDLAWPQGMRRVELFDLQGRRLHAALRADGETRVGIPVQLRAGLLRVRFSE